MNPLLSCLPLFFMLTLLCNNVIHYRYKGNEEVQINVIDKRVERESELQNPLFSQNFDKSYSSHTILQVCTSLWFRHTHGIREYIFAKVCSIKKDSNNNMPEKGCLRTKDAHLSAQVEARQRLHAGCSHCAPTLHHHCNPSHSECTSAAISKNCPVEVSHIFMLPTTSKQIKFCNCLLVTAMILNWNLLLVINWEIEESIFS